MLRQYDIIVFGATGYTGRYLISYMDDILQNMPLKWAVAGRSESKMTQIIAELEASTETSFQHVPTIVADVEEPETLRAMARRTRLLINCCGPFRTLGEPVVRACVKEGTHYLDVSGEPEYLERVQQRYGAAAREKGVYVVGSCGFDSVPVDLGVVFLQARFEGTLHSVRSYLDGGFDRTLKGAVINTATWESAANGMGSIEDLKEVRKKLFRQPLPRFAPRLERSAYPHRVKELGGRWAALFLVADKSVVYRTQRFLYESESIRPCKIETYVATKSFYLYLGYIWFCLNLLVLAQFKIGRRLLLKYPEFFSLGFFSNTPPTPEKAESLHYNFILIGEGWKQKVNHPVENDLHKMPLNKSLVVKVSGRNPAYFSTAVFVISAAAVVLTEPDKMPPLGGVYTPGFAFRNTSYIQKLQDNDIKFEVLYEKDLK